jgi:hypothetical protein
MIQPCSKDPQRSDLPAITVIDDIVGILFPARVEAETPEISPNPNIPATIATIKNSIAHISQVVTPLLFILFFIVLYQSYCVIYS